MLEFEDFGLLLLLVLLVIIISLISDRLFKIRMRIGHSLGSKLISSVKQRNSKQVYQLLHVTKFVIVLISIFITKYIVIHYKQLLDCNTVLTNSYILLKAPELKEINLKSTNIAIIINNIGLSSCKCDLSNINTIKREINSRFLEFSANNQIREKQYSKYTYHSLQSQKDEYKFYGNYKNYQNSKFDSLKEYANRVYEGMISIFRALILCLERFSIELISISRILLFSVISINYNKKIKKNMGILILFAFIILFPYKPLEVSIEGDEIKRDAVIEKNSYFINGSEIIINEGGIISKESIDDIINDYNKNNGTTHIITAIKFIGNKNIFIENMKDWDELIEINMNNTGYTIISDRAFSNCYNLSKIIFPINLVSIGTEAFLNNIALKKIIIPKVGSISQNAFKGCLSLHEVHIHSRFRYGINVFDQCESLKYLYYYNNKDPIGLDQKYIFGSVKNQVTVFVPYNYRNKNFAENEIESTSRKISKEKDLHIDKPNFMEVNGNVVSTAYFNFTIDLERVIVSGQGDLNGSDIEDALYEYYGHFNWIVDTLIIDGDGSINIVDHAFKYFNQLENISMKNWGNSYVGEACCQGNSNLREFHFPPYLTEIRKYAFKQCHQLTSVRIPQNAILWGYCFAECYSLFSVFFEGTFQFTNYVFEGSSSIGDVRYMGKRTPINYLGEHDETLFYTNPSLLNNINLFVPIDYIDNHFVEIPIYEWNKLLINNGETISMRPNPINTHIPTPPPTRSPISTPPPTRSPIPIIFEIYIYPNNYKIVENELFISVMGHIDSSMIQEVFRKFWDQYPNTNIPDIFVFVGNNITTIDKAGFIDNITITSIRFENGGYTNIGPHAFEDMVYLRSVILPNKLSSIGHNAFQNTNLTTITIPSRCIVESFAFMLCSSLKTAYINSDVTFGDCVFMGCTSLVDVCYCGVTPPKYLYNYQPKYQFSLFANGSPADQLPFGNKINVYVPLDYNGTTFAEVEYLMRLNINDKCELPANRPVRPQDVIPTNNCGNNAKGEGNDSNNKDSNVGAIVGGVSAGFIVLIVIILIAVFFMLRSQRHSIASDSASDYHHIDNDSGNNMNELESDDGIEINNCNQNLNKTRDVLDDKSKIVSDDEIEFDPSPMIDDHQQTSPSNDENSETVIGIVNYDDEIKNDPENPPMALEDPSIDDKPEDVRPPSKHETRQERLEVNETPIDHKLFDEAVINDQQSQEQEQTVVSPVNRKRKRRMRLDKNQEQDFLGQEQKIEMNQEEKNEDIQEMRDEQPVTQSPGQRRRRKRPIIQEPNINEEAKSINQQSTEVVPPNENEGQQSQPVARGRRRRRQKQVSDPLIDDEM